MNINVEISQTIVLSHSAKRYVLFFEAGETLWKRTPTRNAWTTSEVAAGFGKWNISQVSWESPVIRAYIS